MQIRNPLHAAYHSLRRKDAKMAARIIELLDLEPESAAAIDLTQMLWERIGDCRDLFALRGVRPKGMTALRLAGRVMGRDPECATQLDRVSAGQGASLAHAMSALVEKIAQDGFPPKVRATAKAFPTQPTLMLPAPSIDVIVETALELEQEALPVELTLAEVIHLPTRPFTGPVANEAQLEVLAA